jgi:hypothetical protein
MTDILKIVLPPLLNFLIIVAIILFLLAMRERLAQLLTPWVSRAPKSPAASS